ncbi:hypothetical protein IFU37_014660 [Pantoea agglomerans]|uniref:hypothetical protein n=1 Tax=Enterobacter agglomerans TaxID=549 RepID=UPI00177ACC77|nr:hypothetical protein [Pantoea agglomerans]WVL88853.1 hypothetical protein IFU37_014660 [Pantoea agglomerans]
MSNKLLSVKLQKDILRALSIFHPHPMTTRQYLSCFDDVDELRMLANIEELIRQGLVHQEALRCCEGEQFLCLGRLKLESKGYDLASAE